MRLLLFALLAGLLSALGFEPLGLWPLMLIACAIMMWLVRRAPNLGNALALGWWFGVGQFTLGLNWIATSFTYQAAMPAWLGGVSVLMLSLYLAIYPAMATGLAWRYGRQDRLVFVLLFAASWTITEWLRATLFTGFAWNPVGVALLPTGVALLAAFVGTYGLSGIAIMLAGALLLIFERDRKAGFALLVIIAAASLIVGLIDNDRGKSGAGIPITIVQPNIGQEQKWSGGSEERNFARLQQLSIRRDLAKPSSPGPRLLLWPEAAVTRPMQDERRNLYFRQRTQHAQTTAALLLNPRDLLLTGGVAVQSKDGMNVSSATNSIFAINSEGDIIGRYDKAHLVPYGEYLPARPILSRLGLSRLVPGDVDFNAGPGPRTIALPGIGKIGLQICYEIVFSGAVVDRKNRPIVIFNPSNDAWFGRWGPPQHLAQARLRAIEEGLPVLRSTPTGISAVIDANGRILASIPWRQAGAINSVLPPARSPTLFARAGNILPFLFAFLLIGIVIAVRRKAR
jgi:apolipoprotein N-acyltransferase